MWTPKSQANRPFNEKTTLNIYDESYEYFYAKSQRNLTYLTYLSVHAGDARYLCSERSEGNQEE